MVIFFPLPNIPSIFHWDSNMYGLMDFSVFSGLEYITVIIYFIAQNVLDLAIESSFKLVSMSFKYAPTLSLSTPCFVFQS